MGENNNNENELQWTCCNDEQTLFILFYVAFSSLAFVILKTLIAKPLRLMAVFLHEYSHATAAWLTGGHVEAIHVYLDEGGVTSYSGGWRWCVIPAGYIGCGFWAMVLVIFSGGRRTATFAAASLTLALLIALCYTPNRTMIYLNLGYAIVILLFVTIEWFVYTPILQFVILFFGIFVGIAAVNDIHSDTIVRSVQGSDSHACTAEVCPCIPPRCIGLQWVMMAIFFQCLGIWVALVQMSNECQDLGWFACFLISVDLDFNWDGVNFFADFEGFWDNE